MSSKCMTGSASKTCRSFCAGDVILSCEPWIWAFQWNMYGKICAFCFTERAGLRTCSGCKLHRYCSATCQTADWKKEHKRECCQLKDVASKIAPNASAQQDCYGQSCGVLAGFVSEILMTKLAWKLKLNVAEDLPGLGKKSPSEILSLFPRKTQLDSKDKMCPLMHRRMHVVRSLILAALASESEIPVSSLENILYEVVQYNGYPILEPGPKDPGRRIEKLKINVVRRTDHRIDHRIGRTVRFTKYGGSFSKIAYAAHAKERAVGSALFPLAQHRSMVPVCMDLNVSMDFRGRMLLIHAAEDIPNYTGLGDLRYNEFTGYQFCMTRKDRRDFFEKAFGHPCQCRKCTEEYDAELNPLKCGTIGCSERIPSDDRALGACCQCGALNASRLKTFRRFMDKHDSIQISGLSAAQACIKKADLLKEIDASGILHGDAHIRYVCGWNYAMVLTSQKQYEAGCKLFQDLVVCLRKIYPKYHVERARALIEAASCPVIGLKAIVRQEIFVEPFSEELRLLSIFRKGCWPALTYCLEARDIYVKLCGEESALAVQADHFVADVERQLE